jgi:tRNA dimethylallyltransferase
MTEPAGLGDPPPVVGVVGPTGTGKSDLGVALAQILGGEVVGADASQLYRGMNIGTAKLTAVERAAVPHHQLDVLDVTQEASVAAYQRHARDDITGIRARGGVALVVGGSGLYVRAALDRLDIPPTDPGVRRDLDERAERLGAPALHHELGLVDPRAAAAIGPKDTRRVVRALEVIALTGRPFSASMPAREFRQPTVLVGLRIDRVALDRRLEDRARRMFDTGLVEETRRLVELGLRGARTASRAVGYAEALAVMDGSATVDEAVSSTAARTRRLVRRQESWFGADPRVTWFDPLREGDHLVERVRDHVEATVSTWRAGGGDNGRHG